LCVVPYFRCSKWINTADLTNVENSITNLQLSSVIIKNNNATAQNTTIITNYYVDGTDGNIMNINNSTPYYNSITGFNVTATGSTYGMSGFFISSNTLLTTRTSPMSGLHINTNLTAYMRINLDFNTAFQVSQVSINYNCSESGTYYIYCSKFNVYGSNCCFF